MKDINKGKRSAIWEPHILTLSHGVSYSKPSKHTNKWGWVSGYFPDLSPLSNLPCSRHPESFLLHICKALSSPIPELLQLLPLVFNTLLPDFLRARSWLTAALCSGSSSLTPFPKQQPPTPCHHSLSPSSCLFFGTSLPDIICVFTPYLSPPTRI